MSVERYMGQPLPLVFSFESNPFTVYNKDYSDIVSLVVNLKKDLVKDEDDKYMQQTLVSGNVVIEESTHTFTTTIDYTNLNSGDNYKIIMAVDLGFSELVEFCMEKDNDLKITTDKNRA
jgi:hypothetical protein